jgi:hypothetical protein
MTNQYVFKNVCRNDEVVEMLENLLWAVFGVLSALVGILAVYFKNSQKIMRVSPDKQIYKSELDKRSKKLEEDVNLIKNNNV